jgi:hypothetical protein
MISALILVVFAAFTGQLPAPTAPTGSGAVAPVDEFRRIALAHSELRSYDLRIDVSVEINGSSVPFHAAVRCDDRQRCLRLFQGSTTLETPQLSLLIDKTDRTITVRHRKPADVTETTSSQATVAMDPSKAFETWRQNGGNVSGGDMTSNGQHWIVNTGKPEFPRLEMYVDEKSHLLRRVLYESKAASGIATKVDIHYSWGDPARIDRAEFEQSRFVKEESGTISPVEGYADYRVINSDQP